MSKLATVDQASAGFECGTFTAGDTAAHRLLSTSKLCKRIFLSAPVDGAGVAQNTKPVFFGDQAHQGDWFAPDGSRDRMVHIDDPAKLYIKLGQANEELEYRIEY